MTVILNRQDLINLIKGTKPSPSQYNHPLVRRLGTQTNSWKWAQTFPKDIPNTTLWSIYQSLKASNGI